MGRRILLLALVGVMMTACGSGDTVGSTTSTSTTSSTTATTVATTTVATMTTEASEDQCEPAPVAVGSGAWQPGCVYTADQFVVPISFIPSAEGWVPVGTADVFVALKNDADGDGGSDVSLTFFAHNVDSQPTDILDEIEAFEEVATLSEREAVIAAGVPTLVLDVEGAPREGEAFEGDNGCSAPPATALMFQGSGYLLEALTEQELPNSIGVPACYPTRVWVFDVEGTTITAMGVARNIDDFNEFMPLLDDFLANSVTFGGGNG